MNQAVCSLLCIECTLAYCKHFPRELIEQVYYFFSLFPDSIGFSLQSFFFSWLFENQVESCNFHLSV